MCNIQDSGDTSVRMAIGMSLHWRYQDQDGHRFVGDTSVRKVITLLEIPASGWSLLCWRYQCQDGCRFVGDTSIRMYLFIMICIYSELDALIVCIRLACIGLFAAVSLGKMNQYIDPWIKFSP